MPESAKLAAFLLSLDVSPEAFARFQENPRREMRQFGLSRATIDAVLSGDAVGIWHILLAPPTRSFHIAVVVGTHPKPGPKKTRKR